MELGYVFNLITYGGHQIDGLAAAEEFATRERNLRDHRGPARSQHPLGARPEHEVGQVLVAGVNPDGVKALLAPDRKRLEALIERRE